MNPYSQPTNYIDLLNSQPGPQLFPYEHLNPSVQLGSSQLPIFGTQHAEGSSLGGDTPAEPRERKAWSPPDDLLLISAWLNTSKDPVVCNEQKAGTFWKRVADCVTESARVAGSVIREPSHCKNRWQKINEIVQKFCGSYAAATRERSSGQNDGDVVKRAYEIFYNDYGKKFHLEHAWRELRYDQKWCDLYTSKTDATSKHIGYSSKFS